MQHNFFIFKYSLADITFHESLISFVDQLMAHDSKSFVLSFNLIKTAVHTHYKVTFMSSLIGSNSSTKLITHRAIVVYIRNQTSAVWICFIKLGMDI